MPCDLRRSIATVSFGLAISFRSTKVCSLPIVCKLASVSSLRLETLECGLKAGCSFSGTEAKCELCPVLRCRNIPFSQLATPPSLISPLKSASQESHLMPCNG